MRLCKILNQTHLNYLKLREFIKKKKKKSKKAKMKLLKKLRKKKFKIKKMKKPRNKNELFNKIFKYI